MKTHVNNKNLSILLVFRRFAFEYLIHKKVSHLTLRQEDEENDDDVEEEEE